MSRVVRRDCSGRTYDIVAQTTRSAAATKLSYLDVSACVLHLHDKRCSLGIHESLLMIVTSFALRSPSPLYIFIFARSHPQIYLYTAPYIYVFYIAPAHPHCHPFTSTLSFSVSIYIFSTVLDNHMSRSRATRRLVLQFLIIRASCSKSPQHMSHV